MKGKAPMESPNCRTWPTPKEFIQAWQQSTSVKEVATKLGMNTNNCHVRASRYRARGIPLKDFPAAPLPSWDWDELAAYAEELAQGRGSEGAPVDRVEAATA
jgi:hypothetical protein